jgi:hypothetical protein
LPLPSSALAPLLEDNTLDLSLYHDCKRAASVADAARLHGSGFNEPAG